MRPSNINACLMATELKSWELNSWLELPVLWTLSYLLPLTSSICTECFSCSTWQLLFLCNQKIIFIEKKGAFSDCKYFRALVPLKMCFNPIWGKIYIPYFFDQMLRLLFKDGVYFFGKPADINDSWIRYVRAIQRRLLDAGSSIHNLSVLLSAMEKSCTTRTALALARWPSSELFACVCVCRVLLRLLFEGGV